MAKELEIYEKFCRPKFSQLEEKVDNLCKTVNDGLKDDVKELKATNRWMMGILVGLLITVIASMAKLWIDDRNQYHQLEKKIEQVESSISDTLE